MNTLERISKYNYPVPRYTSYPPANLFQDFFSGDDYSWAVTASNVSSQQLVSFYIHIPFCKHLCHYCGCNSQGMKSEETIARYVDCLHQEINHVKGQLSSHRKLAQIHYGGGSPTAIPLHYLKELNAHLLEGVETIDQPEIAIECHPGYLNEEDWDQLIDAGFTRFSLGVQDFNEDVLKTANRRPALLPVEAIVKKLHAAGARVNLDFIYGLPKQTAASFKATIQRAVDAHPDRLVTFSYAHVPWVNKAMLILEKVGLPSSEEKQAMFENATEVLHQAGYASIGMDHFVRPDDELYVALREGNLHRNFQGYCTRRTTGQVYAFGVSAISQLDSVYAQNTKVLDEYMQHVKSGNSPVVRGYQLTPSLQIVRALIDMLMCNNRITWPELEQHVHMSKADILAQTAYNQETFHTFVEDGLLVQEQDVWTMTPEGLPFVRNIAAAFDPLLVEGTQTFSKPL